MGVDKLKDVRTQRFLNCVLVFCMMAWIYLYILCFSRPQTVTHCVLAFLRTYFPPGFEPREQGPVFRPCRPAVAGRPTRWGNESLPPNRPRIGEHSGKGRGRAPEPPHKAIFLFCKSQPPQ